MLDAAKAKARRGELRLSVPFGYIWHREAGLGLDPDLRLQEVIRLIFTRFSELGGRRWEGARTVDGLNTAILAGSTTAARRAGWYARNNPWVAASVDSLVGNVVGAGIKPQSTHPDREVRERLQALWLRWTEHADPGGRGNAVHSVPMVRPALEPWR